MMDDLYSSLPSLYYSSANISDLPRDEEWSNVQSSPFLFQKLPSASAFPIYYSNLGFVGCNGDSAMIKQAFPFAEGNPPVPVNTVASPYKSSALHDDVIELINSENERSLKMVPNQLLLKNLSGLKAKERMVSEKRKVTEHKAQQAQQEFLECIAKQEQKISAARVCQLHTKSAFKKVIELQKEVAAQDREIHRIEEEEDSLYQHLIESQANMVSEDSRLTKAFR